MEAATPMLRPFWAGGPSPGELYSPVCPGPGYELPAGGVARTLSPMVTGTSVLGLKFEGGVVLAADLLGSYGSLARFRNISRMMKVNDSTVLGASGDYADFQYLKQVVEQMVIDEELLGDGHSYSPKAIHSWLTRAMYNRRSKMNPLWNTVLIGGYADGERDLGFWELKSKNTRSAKVRHYGPRHKYSFLGYVDMLGVAYEASSLATGYASYVAQPLMRKTLEKQPVLSKQEARALIERCMKILYYRDARSFNKYEITTVTEKGVEVEGPLSLETNWDIAHLVSGFE